jgi:hypothetical protein
MSYVNAGDTLTIQMQGPSPVSTIGAGIGLLISGGVSISDKIAQNIVSYMGGQGFASAIDSDNINTDGSIFVQIDVTANQDYADSSDVLSIAETAWYNSGTNMLPSSAAVSDINGVSTGVVGTAPIGTTTALGAAANPSTIATPVGSALSSIGTGLQQFGTTTVILIVVLVLALLYFLTTEGGQNVAKLAVA